MLQIHSQKQSLPIFMTASKNSSKMFGYAYYTEEEIDLENMTS